MRIIYQAHHILLLMAVLFLSACSNEEDLQEVKEPAILKVIVGKDAASSESRAAISGYSTTFEAGDMIGVYVVNEGSEICSNVPYVFNGTTWELADATKKAYYSDSFSYFAYYPYQAEMGYTTAYLDDADGFFSLVVDNWTPQTDQSTLSSYNASDLLIGKGTGNSATASVTFSLYHTMGLVEIRLNDATGAYVNDLSGYDSKVYFKEESIASAPIPYNTGNIFYYIGKPGQTIDFYFTENGQTQNKNCVPEANHVVDISFYTN